MISKSWGLKYLYAVETNFCPVEIRRELLKEQNFDELSETPSSVRRAFKMTRFRLIFGSISVESGHITIYRFALIL